MKLPKLCAYLCLWLPFLAGPVVAATTVPDIIPAAHQWSVRHRVGNEIRTLTFPDAYAKITDYAPQDRAQILEVARRLERNIDYVRRVGRAFYANPGLGDFRIVPDKDLTLKEVVIAVREQVATPLARHEPILAALPTYTRIHIITPKDSVERVQKELQGLRLLNRSTLHPVDVWVEKTERGFAYRRPTRWVRDAFLPGKDAQGKPVQFLPIAYSDIRDLTRNDLGFFEKIVDGPQRVLRMPVFVRGGNLQVATIGNERVLFVGEREFRYNEEIFLATTQYLPPESLLLDVLKRVSGADRIVVLPNSDHLFHLDMVMTLPRPGAVAVIAPIDPDRLDAKDREVIDRVRSEVAKLSGLKRIDVPTTAARVSNFQSVVNAVPFRDAQTGQRSVLLPEYPDQMVQFGGATVALNKLVRDAFSRTGVKPIPIEERFFPLNGNTHCVIVGVS